MKASFKNLLHTQIKGIPHEYQWASFLLPVLLLSVAFASWKVHPLGETSLLTSDLFHQYAPILAEIRAKILSGESLFYTWNMGLGTNFWPILSYNGASPLNLLLLLFPSAYLSDGITILILIRTGLSGLFFSLLLYRKDGREGAVTLALSTVYALCGYVLAYFWALMWMDAVVLLPLIILGLWKIFAGENPRLYIAALFLVIFSNFYFGFFVCMFLVFFAPVVYLEARQRGVCRLHPAKAGLRFATYSLLSAGMTAVLLIPALLAVRSTSAAADSLVMTADFSFTLFDFLGRFLLHADPVIREGLPNVFCSVVVLLIIPLYALCRTIPFSQRAVSLLLVLFLYLSMSSPVLNFFWHGMHYTNQIPYRQAFVLCFLLIYMAGQVLFHMDGISRKKVYFAGVAVLSYLVILNQSGEAPKNYWLIYGSAAFVIVYTTILSGFFASETGRRRARKAFLYAIILEMFFAAEFAMVYIEKTEHFTYAPSYGQYADSISKDISAADAGMFSRTVLLPSLTRNDGALYQLKTIPIFASTTSLQFVQFMAGLGFANNQAYEVGAEGLTDVSACILGVRNVVSLTGEKAIQESNSDPVIRPAGAVLGAAATEGAATGGAATGEEAKTDVMYTGYNIVTNENVLPLGFYVPSENILATSDSLLSPFEQTNALLKSMGGLPAYKPGSLEMITSSNIEKSSDANAYSFSKEGQTSSISFTPEGSGRGTKVLLYLGTRQKATVRVSRLSTDTGENTVSVMNPYEGQIIDCGTAPSDNEANMTIQLIFSSPYTETFPIYCYSIDQEALDFGTKNLASQPFTVTSYNSSNMAGTVDFEKDGALFTSIPYDKGWSVTVDGNAVETQAAYGAWVSVPVTKGVHKINFSYQPPGFLPGLLISLIFAADFILIFVWNPASYISRRKASKNSAKPPQGRNDSD